MFEYTVRKSGARGFTRVAAVQLAQAALDGLADLVDLLVQPLEHAVGIRFGLLAHLLSLASGALLDLRGAALGSTHQAVLGQPTGGVLLGLAQQAVGLSLRLGQDLIALLGDTTGG